jgi:predicted nucleic acid-binding protein
MATEPERRITDPTWLSWPGATAACAQLGCKRKDLQQFVTDGELAEVTMGDGSKRYDPTSVEALKKTLALAIQNERSQDVSTDVVRSMVEHLKQAHAHNERLIELLLKHYETAMTVVTTANTHLQERCDRAETILTDAMIAREAALDDQATRKLVLDREAAAEMRRARMLDAVLPGIEPVMTNLAEAGLALVMGPEGSLYKRLVDSFDDTRIEVLLNSGFLDPTQAELLREILRKRHGSKEESRQEGSQEGAQEGSQEGGQEGGQEGTQEGSQEGGQEGTQEGSQEGAQEGKQAKRKPNRPN